MLADRAGRSRVGSRVALLDNMGQLVNQQLHPGRGVRLVPALPHHDVPPERVRLRVDRVRRLGGLGIGVYAYMLEVVTESLLDGGPGGRVQSPARGTKDRRDAGRDLRRTGCAVAGPVDRLILIVVAGTRWALDAAAPLDLC